MFPDITNNDSGFGASGFKFGVIVEELMEPVDNVNTITDGAQEQLPLGGREHSACRSDSENEMIRSAASVC